MHCLYQQRPLKCSRSTCLCPFAFSAHTICGVEYRFDCMKAFLGTCSVAHVARNGHFRFYDDTTYSIKPTSSLLSPSSFSALIHSTLVLSRVLRNMMHPVSLHRHPAGLLSAPSRKLPDTKHACPLLLLAWSPNHDALSRCRNVSVFDTWKRSYCIG
jgi:hypothetical protein